MAMPDIVELTDAVQKRVCDGRKRFYAYFGCTPFIGGMSRGMTCGCNFRCSMCLSPFREFVNGETRFILPSLYKDVAKTAGFYDPEEVIEICVHNEKEKKIDDIALFDGVVPRKSKFQYLDVGYAEIAIGKEHLIGLCQAAAKTGFIFVVETNGWLLGYDTTYAKELSKYRDSILVRVGVKAGSEKYNDWIIGCKNVGDYVFKGIKNLLDAGITPDVAMMCDRRFYEPEEIELMRNKIRATGYKGEITEEKAFPYYTAYKRWIERGNDPYKWAVNGKIQLTGKRILGTYMLERFEAENLLVPKNRQKINLMNGCFEQMQKDFDPAFAKRLIGKVIEFSIDDNPGGTWSFKIGENDCELHRGIIRTPLTRYIMKLDQAVDCFIYRKLDLINCIFDQSFIIEGNDNLIYDIALTFNHFGCREVNAGPKAGITEDVMLGENVWSMDTCLI